jgi:hypothetical protein
MPAASCSVPQMKSLAGVAAYTSPRSMPRSASRCPGDSTPVMGAVPLLTMEPMAFSTMFDSPPFLLPGVVLALRSTRPWSR